MPNPIHRLTLPLAVRRGLAGVATTAGVLLSVVGLPAMTASAHAADAVATTDLGPAIPANESARTANPVMTLFHRPVAALPPGGVQDLAAVADPDHTQQGSARTDAGREVRTSRSATRRAPRATIQLDARTLSKAMGGTVSLARYQELLPAFNKALINANATTVRRVAMFCAQIGHESVGLKYMEEIASGAAYNGRVDLGNVHPGDGQRFKGRGPIQITGRANYSTVSAWAHQRGTVPTRDYFIDHPAYLSSDRYGFEGAVWYWTSARKMNIYADRNDIVGATRAVNGGTNGLDDRIARWRHCLTMGETLLGR